MTLPPDQKALKPRKSARQTRSAATVEVILEAAARILETHGSAGYTTNAVAVRAGVSVGSLYQYFPNKDAITRALIRRETAALEAAIDAIDVRQDTPSPLTQFVMIAIRQQLDRPRLAQLLEVEEDRLDASVDIDPARDRVVTRLCGILGVGNGPDGRAIAQDIVALVATLVNAAGERGERDAERLLARTETVVRARLTSV